MAHWHRQLTRILTDDYCPLYIHWPPWSAPNAGQQLRLWACRYQGRGHRAFLRRAFMLALTISWPVCALLLIGQNLRKFAPKIAQRTGKPIWRQGWEQLWLAFVHALPPVAYYHYEFYRPEQWPLVDQYLHQHEASSLLPYLNRYHCHPAIDNKAVFAQLCAEAGLPTVPILAVCKAGGVTWYSKPQQDLFLKPVVGARGEGTHRWRLAGERDTEEIYQDTQGNKLTKAELTAALIALSQKRDYLVQPSLFNHPAIADLSPDALATIRIVTGRTPDGDIEPIAATFKMAWRPSVINTHGLNSALDLTTGLLGPAYSYRLISVGFDRHPFTKAQIVGRSLPDWPKAVALAQAAHQHFPGYVFLGWDVALTHQGPLLLEGNAGWDVLTVQKPQRTPLAYTRFAALCALWRELA